MKTLLLENTTLFSGKILVFEPEKKVRDVRLNKYDRGEEKYPAIYFDTASKDGNCIELDECLPEANAYILHLQPLARLIESNGAYFAETEKVLRKKNLDLQNTFICETPGKDGIELFRDLPAFRRKLALGELSLEKYELLYELTGFREFMREYFRQQAYPENFLALWNWVHSPTGQFSRFLNNHLFQQNQRWMRKKKKR